MEKPIINEVANLPEAGQAVRVRNRLATVRSVTPYDSPDGIGRFNLIELEYFDDRRYPENENILWEVEATAEILGASSLPNVDELRPDHPEALQSFIHAHQWTRINRLLTESEVESQPLLSIWNSPVQIHPYQLEAIVRALKMPRVSLLLADGVGLGKTIQAGLVLQELLLRRKIRRVLIICPALLQRQWKSELERKFNLDFQIIDQESTFEIQQHLGIDTNPWKAFPRIITSMDFLRMPDIQHQFLNASGVDQGGESRALREAPTAPWDLLIVDECHNFAPQSSHRASQRYRMLRGIRFLFEHRLFLSATPHNGKTVSFTGVLELLDPVRFQIHARMDKHDRANLMKVKIRRLKDDISKISLHSPFADQLPPKEIPITLSSKEARLFAAVRQYRIHGQSFLESTGNAAERWVGYFIFSVMTKRLLSCPFAFARTWWRHVEKERSEGEVDLFGMTRTAVERAEEASCSDDERSIAEEDVSKYGGVWLREKSDELTTFQNRVAAALESLGYSRDVVMNDDKLDEITGLSDAKTEELVTWVKANLFTPDGKLRNDERLIVFTEYRETLEFLRQRFLREGFNDDTMLMLYGGMRASEFQLIQSQFEDEEAPVRLLLATDAASEGINMQEQCRWVVHYDIPWSPTKLQQRNGRVWRHGQLRDVQVHYFRCDQDEDLEFLLKVAKKVETVRDDLGSIEQVFDEALQNHFRGHSVDFQEIDLKIEETHSSSSDRKDLQSEDENTLKSADQCAKRMLERTRDALGISPTALETILRTAMQIEGIGNLEPIPDRPSFFRLSAPPAWEALVKDTLMTDKGQHRLELVFDDVLVTEELNGRRLLRLKKHQRLMRLGHPVMRRAMATLKRQLHEPSERNGINRWTISALHRSDIEALLIFHYILTATNELREPLHDEVISEVFRVEGNHLFQVEPGFRDTILREHFIPIKSEVRCEEWWKTIRLSWDTHKGSLEKYMQKKQGEHRSHLISRAKEALQEDTKATKEAYQFRIKSLEESRRNREYEDQARQLVKNKAMEAQQSLLADLQAQRERELRETETYIEILRQNVDEMKRRLEGEQEKRLNSLLPKRYAIRDVRVLPLAVEYVIPAAAEDLV